MDMINWSMGAIHPESDTLLGLWFRGLHHGSGYAYRYHPPPCLGTLAHVISFRLTHGDQDLIAG